MTRSPSFPTKGRLEYTRGYVGFLQVHPKHHRNIWTGGAYQKQNAAEGTDVSLVGDKRLEAVRLHEELRQGNHYVYPQRPDDR